MSLAEQERQAMEAKRRGFIALKQVAENAIVEGLADQFDDDLVDFVGSARFIDRRLGTDESIRRIASILHTPEALPVNVIETLLAYAISVSNRNRGGRKRSGLEIF